MRRECILHRAESDMDLAEVRLSLSHTRAHTHLLLRCLLRGWMCFVPVFYGIPYLCSFFLSYKSMGPGKAVQQKC